MARRLEFNQAFDPIEVDYNGHVFVTVDLPRSKAREAEEILGKMLEAEDDDAVVATWGELFDHLLQPIAGGKTKISTLIKRDWKADKLTLAQIESFNERLAAERRAERARAVEEQLTARPT